MAVDGHAGAVQGADVDPHAAVLAAAMAGSLRLENSPRGS